MNDLNIMGLPTTREALLRVDNTAINGPQKLLQRLLVLLFTDNRVETNLGIGTELSDDDVGNISDLEVIRNQYNIALASVKDTLLVETLKDADASERIKDAQLQVQETDERGTVEITITVTTQAGDDVSVSVPVETSTELENGS